MVLVLWSGKTLTLFFRVIPFFELKVLIQIPDVFSFNLFLSFFVSEITFIPSFHLQWTEDEKSPLQEVYRMKEEQIGEIVDSWIAQEEIPRRANLKVIKSFDPYEGMDCEEIEAYLEFRSWYMAKDHIVLLSIPKPFVEKNFWPEPDDAVTFAYGSVDFQRLRGDFDKYAYRIQKILDRVKDLAQSYSCISHDEGKKNIQARYEALVHREFRDKVIELAQAYHKNRLRMDYEVVRAKIKEQYSHIIKCEKVWKQNAFET